MFSKTYYSALPKNIWHHHTFLLKATGIIEYYFDGTLRTPDDTSGTAIAISITGPLIICNDYVYDTGR